MTNFEKIKQMDLEQMADFLNHIGGDPCGYCTFFGDDYCDDCYGGICGWLHSDNLDIYRIHIEDVAPVIHAKWEEKCRGIYECSNCKCAEYKNVYWYCPNCGARMDKE